MNNLDNTNVENLYSIIVSLIENAKRNVAIKINSEMTFLYWNIGKYITENILDNKKAEYGKSIINKLSKKLVIEYGKGYSKANIFRMLKFYEYFTDIEKFSTLSRKLSWSHFVELLQISDKLKREFYTIMCADNKMSTNLFFRDPYILDFLDLKDTYSEKDLENAILNELERFILEMGNDFAFLSRQKRITIDGEDYYIDLLFYHRKMKRLVIIELKLDKFKPEYKGQVELYLKWLNRYEEAEGEETPIAIILCASKSNMMAELLELDNSGIHVAQYLTKYVPKDILQQKFIDSIEKAKKQLEQRKNIED